MTETHRPKLSHSPPHPHHLNTTIESGNFDSEKTLEPTTKPVDEEEDEDIDALIDDLASDDGFLEGEEGEPDIPLGGAYIVPDNQLQTDTRIGLTEVEVLARRKKYGLNQMKEEKENLIKKFLMYFVGPIQFAMEVRWHARVHISPGFSRHASATPVTHTNSPW
jgi:H+-transporting ATPase